MGRRFGDEYSIRDLENYMLGVLAKGRQFLGRLGHEL